MAIATEVGIFPAILYHILTNSLGKQKVCPEWIPHVLNDDQRVMHILLATHAYSSCYPCAALEK